MAESQTPPNLAQLRMRQDQLVHALTVETDTNKLARFSTELEETLRTIEQEVSKGSS